MSLAAAPTEIVILAAGRGTRMASEQHKSLQLLGGSPLLHHVLHSAAALKAVRLHLVIGPADNDIRAACADFPAPLHWVMQDKPLGTGHAVRQALPGLHPEAMVLILCSDTPLLHSATLRALLDGTPASGLGLLTARLQNPFGYGRVQRDSNGRATAIVEEKDATPEQRSGNEVSSGVLCASVARLQHWLPLLNNDNAQREYYLSDLVQLALRDACPLHTVQAQESDEIHGINTIEQLALGERLYQRRQALQLLREGVMLGDPGRFDVRGELRHSGAGTFLDVGVLLEGTVTLGQRVRVGPYSIIRDSVLGDDTEVRPYSILDNVVVGKRCIIGPFARLRPGTELEEQVNIGNFVETKQASIGTGSKINHLSYVGDATLEENVNFGAGAITCNYDGKRKNHTRIGAAAFIGSNASLVAPLEIGARVVIGAGSAITKSVPENVLAVGRTPQRIFKHRVQEERTQQRISKNCELGESAQQRTPKNCEQGEPTQQRTPKNHEQGESAQQRTPKNCEQRERTQKHIPKNREQGESAQQRIPKNREQGEPAQQRTPKNCEQGERTQQRTPKNHHQEKRMQQRIPKNLDQGEPTQQRILKNRDLGDR